jgi:alcohol dehydrogenase (cytochrome c)
MLTTGCGATGTAAAGGGGGGGRGGGGGGRGGGGGGGAPINVGGLGTGDANTCGNARLGGGILFVDGTIYASTPDNVFAIDARDGTLLWHYYWKTRGGTSLQTRGVGMWHNYIYFELHDDWVVCLDARNGKEVWRHEISPFDQQYFSANAPMILGDHHRGTGNDLDSPTFKSLDLAPANCNDAYWRRKRSAARARDVGEPYAAPRRGHHGSPGRSGRIFRYGQLAPRTQGRGDGENLLRIA